MGIYSEVFHICFSSLAASSWHLSLIMKMGLRGCGRSHKVSRPVGDWVLLTLRVSFQGQTQLWWLWHHCLRCKCSWASVLGVWCLSQLLKFTKEKIEKENKCLGFIFHWTVISLELAVPHVTHLAGKSIGDQWGQSDSDCQLATYIQSKRTHQKMILCRACFWFVHFSGRLGLCPITFLQ